MRVIALLAFFVAAVTAVPANPQRIVGGSITNIESYPTITALLFTWNWSNYNQNCGGTILNQRSILTAAHCPRTDPPARWRFRVGSTWGNNGGVIHHVDRIIVHPNFNVASNLDADVAIFRTPVAISYNNAVRAASIAGPNYNLGDNQVVWAAGWGATIFGGANSPQLRHVQIWTVNQQTCVQRYATRNTVVTNNMLCAGWLDVGGRDQCAGDSGGPLYHNGIVVGVCSFGAGGGCGQAFFPGVNARVSRFSSWIQSNA